MDWKDILMLIWGAILCFVGGLVVGCSVTFLVFSFSLKYAISTFIGTIIWWGGHKINGIVINKLKKEHELE